MLGRRADRKTERGDDDGERERSSEINRNLMDILQINIIEVGESPMDKSIECGRVRTCFVLDTSLACRKV